MSMNTMSCDVFHDGLMAYLEDETDAQTRAAVERHAVSCVECGAVLADLRKMRIDAANLPELAPSRDLWAGIAARIDTPVVPIGTGAAGRLPASRGGAMRRLWQVGAVAASLAGAAAIGFAAGRRPATAGVQQVAQDSAASPQTPALDPTMVVAAAPATPEPASTGAGAPAGGRGTATPAAATTETRPSGALLVVASLTADYDREIARLARLLETRRNQMDPATVAIIERNLQIIDAAIIDSKAAIARDPASRFLIESLNQSLQMKVELMRTAAMLPSRT